MDDNIYLIFGYVASANACLMMIPQVYLTLSKKSTEDLSMNTIYLNLLTQSLFFPYSYHFKLYPLFSVNICLTICDISIISFYLYHIKKTPLKEPLLASVV